MNELRIDIFNIVGQKDCTLPEDGDKVFNSLKRALEENKKIVISFQNVEKLTTAFLNNAIGKQLTCIFVDTGLLRKDEAKKHLKILAIETEDMMNFYNSLSPEDLASSFASDKNYTASAVREILQRSKELQDPEFEKEMQTLLSKFQSTPVNN